MDKPDRQNCPLHELCFHVKSWPEMNSLSAREIKQ